MGNESYDRSDIYIYTSEYFRIIQGESEIFYILYILYILMNCYQLQLAIAESARLKEHNYAIFIRKWTI